MIFQWDVKPMKPFKPYFAVIFTSKQSQTIEGYDKMARHMEALAKEQPGFLGLESARNHVGITVSYWESLEAIKMWKEHSEHIIAQKYGRSKWYDSYRVRICKVEREYAFGSTL